MHRHAPAMHRHAPPCTAMHRHAPPCTAMHRADLCAFFNDPRRSDVILLLKTHAEDDAEAAGGDAASNMVMMEELARGMAQCVPSASTDLPDSTLPAAQHVAPPDARYSLHFVVLSAGSKYFEVALSDAWQKADKCGSTAPGGGGASSSSRVTLTEHVNCASELAAADVVLRLIYGASLMELAPDLCGGDRLALLVHCFRLADRWGAPRVCASVVAAMAAFKPRDIDARAVQLFFELPPGLLEDAALSGPRAMFTAALLTLYGDVVATITHPTAREGFLSLPYSAVLTWSKDDNLTVHSENCVLAFFNCSTFIGMLKKIQLFREQGLPRAALAFDVPCGWKAEARRGSSLARFTTITLEMRPTVDELVQVRSQAAPWLDTTQQPGARLPGTSACIYVNGFFLRFAVSTNPWKAAAGAAPNLDLALSVDGPSMSAAFGTDFAKHGHAVLKNVQVTIQVPPAGVGPAPKEYVAKFEHLVCEGSSMTSVGQSSFGSSVVLSSSVQPGSGLGSTLSALVSPPPAPGGQAARRPAWTALTLRATLASVA
ncbi:hypothetical protein FOA52_005876 [Chlamydomonas sp. UWO 241]|nr:hypothetical protein FOA52_005876 [Chlamydomonas sp. UWO 241]